MLIETSLQIVQFKKKMSSFFPDGIPNIFIDTEMKKKIKTFRGCYACDVFGKKVKKLKNKESVIINLSPSTESGSHFVAIRRQENKYCYFDPLNIFLHNEYIDNFLKRNNCVIVKNEKQLQHNDSTLCGFFLYELCNVFRIYYF